ncbi:hypothetical protein NQZ79_g6854 [Umbelopsis isabellina]|nr:hypothetical protein NQZ79_g6854 [Umbelopsis isabellina]
MSLNPFKRDKKKYHVTVEDGAVSSDEEFRQSSDNISMGHRLDDDKIAMGMSEEANTTGWDEIDGLEDLARSERANDQQAIENAHKTANMIKNEQKKSL